MTIPLGRPLPDASRDQPGRRAGNRPMCHPYLVLLRMGFAVPPPLLEARCALTAPFHPYPPSPKAREGGLFSVALSLGSPPPGITRHPVSVEPGLSSGPESPAAIQPSDRADVDRPAADVKRPATPPSAAAASPGRRSRPPAPAASAAETLSALPARASPPLAARHIRSA